MRVQAGAEHPSWEFAEGDELVPGRSVLQRLGGGNRYEALLVWDERLHALMVAKVLRPHLVGDARAMLDLAAEAEALERLQHPVLLRGFDAVLEGERPHLLVEHLEGPTLRWVVRKTGPLGLEQLLPLALHVASALHLLAGEGWVHLDVKPDNIVMGVPPRLIDLSVARPVEAAQVIGSPVGTDAYMAPEQCDPAACPGAIGPAADVFGLGATLQHAWTGHRPFARVEGERYPQLWAEPRPLPAGTPGPLADVIAATLERDPASRPTPAQVVERLESLVASLPRKLTLTRSGMLPVA
jgi:serine/threonine protein kinase